MPISSLKQKECMIVNLDTGIRTQRAYKLFESAIHSPRTLIHYDRDLTRFMDYAETESEVLGIGIALIILNLGIYVGIPVFAIMRFRF